MVGVEAIFGIFIMLPVSAITATHLPEKSYMPPLLMTSGS